jgi:hypothetical protein
MMNIYNKNHLFLFIVIYLLLTVPLSSQVGIKSGPALSDIIFEVDGQIPYLGYGTNSLSHKLPYITYQFGIFNNFSITKRIELQPELLLVKKGLNYSTEFIYDDIKYYIKVHYLEIPILLKYNISKEAKNQFAILLGPYLSYAINNTRYIHAEDQVQEEEMVNIKNLDWGLAASISYNFTIQQNRFVIDFRTTYGLIDMMEYIDGYVKEYYGPNEGRARNVNIALTFGYLLNIGESR